MTKIYFYIELAAHIWLHLNLCIPKLTLLTFTI